MARTSAATLRLVLPLYLRLYPDPALRLLARPVEHFGPDVARLADDMAEAMSAYGGVGLAAPQLGVSQRVIIVRDGLVAYTLVNPRILSSSSDTYVDEEGCLSLPGLAVPVVRSVFLDIEARSPSGEEIGLELEGHAARVVQHEIDHLDGILTLDRLREEDRAVVLPRLRELLRRGWAASGPGVSTL
jgi:peptide deformylase